MLVGGAWPSGSAGFGAWRPGSAGDKCLTVLGGAADAVVLAAQLAGDGCAELGQHRKINIHCVAVSADASSDVGVCEGRGSSGDGGCFCGQHSGGGREPLGSRGASISRVP